MRISIAMATYNGAYFLEAQLDSFLDQIRHPNELIVCDDGSIDATLQILEAFRLKAPFDVHIFRNQTNLGYVKNFEKAISACTGDIVFLSDQDDVWGNNKIQRVLSEFESNESTWVMVNDAALVDEKLGDSGLTVAGQLVSAGIGVEQLLLGCCIAIRAQLKPLLFPIPHHIHGHDGWINTLGNALHRRQFIPDVLQLYRRHGRNTSSSLTTATRRATRWHSLLQKIKLTNIRIEPCVASDLRILQLSTLTSRIADHKVYLQKFENRCIGVDELICEINSLRSLNETRRSIQQLPFLRRTIAALEFYLIGHYRPFEGWKSLARDIVR